LALARAKPPVGQKGGDHFAGVQDASATHSDDHVTGLPAGSFHRFQRKPDCGLCGDPEMGHRHAGVF
jgi:hypothetical protein